MNQHTDQKHTEDDCRRVMRLTRKRDMSAEVTATVPKTPKYTKGASMPTTTYHPYVPVMVYRHVTPFTDTDMQYHIQFVNRSNSKLMVWSDRCSNTEVPDIPWYELWPDQTTLITHSSSPPVQHINIHRRGPDDRRGDRNTTLTTFYTSIHIRGSRRVWAEL